MDRRLLFIQAQHVCQIVLSIYGYRHSYTAISNLRKYEDATKKAAKWSNEVDTQLFTTRMTQGTGFLAVRLFKQACISLRLMRLSQINVSLFAAFTLLLARTYLPVWAVFTISPAMLVVVLGARRYIKNFWAPGQDSRGKDAGTKVPLLPSMAEYNLAVEKTEDLLKVLEYLEYSWLITSFVTGMVGYK